MLRGTKFTAEKSNSQVSVCVNFIIFLTDYHSAISGDRIGYPELERRWYAVCKDKIMHESSSTLTPCYTGLHKS